MAILKNVTRSGEATRRLATPEFLEHRLCLQPLELVAVLGTDERSGLDQAYHRLAKLARSRDLPGVARTLEEARDRTQVREAWLEELFRALLQTG